MDRQEKLHLSNDEAWGCCFVQGVFVRFFERSLYHFNRTARPAAGPEACLPFFPPRTFFARRG